MTQEVKHSPLPWGFSNGSIVDRNYCSLKNMFLNDFANEADKLFIVTACNSHYESLETIKVLKDALEDILKQVEASQEYEKQMPNTTYLPTSAYLGFGHIKDYASNALAKVKS